MKRRLATSWATLTQAARHRFPVERQNPTSVNDDHDQYFEAGIRVPEEEPEPVAKHEQEPVPEEELVHEPKHPIWPEQHAASYSFVIAREEDGRRHFRAFIMAAYDVTEARAVELSL